MRKKLDITAAEMRELREQGFSNHDIAKMLDISYATVLRYIGKQNCRMERLAAFAEDEPCKTAEKQDEPQEVLPKYDPKPFIEEYNLGNFSARLYNAERFVAIMSNEKDVYGASIKIGFDNIPDLVQFLAWAMRTRMEATDESIR